MLNVLYSSELIYYFPRIITKISMFMINEIINSIINPTTLYFKNARIFQDRIFKSIAHENNITKISVCMILLVLPTLIVRHIFRGGREFSVSLNNFINSISKIFLRRDFPS